MSWTCDNSRRLRWSPRESLTYSRPPHTRRHAGRTTGRDPGVIHRGARPKGRRRFVARLAALRRRYVRRRFLHNPRIPATMTGRAARHDSRVIHRGARPEGRGRFMARIARLGRRNMRCGLACCLGAVVAGGTGALHHA